MNRTIAAVSAQGGDGQTACLCEAAHELLDLGLPITLCQPNKKTPITKGWPDKTWTHDEIDAEFRVREDLNVGLVLGPRSGLVDIEIDGPGGDEELLELFDGDVPVTPIWRSARGAHRLLKWHPDLEAIRKSSVTIGSLEVRLGADGRGAQSLVPPSMTEGWGRRWGVSLAECDPAGLPTAVLGKILAAAGVRRGHDCGGEVRHSMEGDCVEGVKHSSRRERGDVEEMRHSIAVFHAVSHSAVSHAVSHSIPPATTIPDHQELRDNDSGNDQDEAHRKATQAAIRRAILYTLPGSEGYRNKLLLQFARQLKGIPELAELEPEELEPYVQEWYELARPAIGTQDFDVTWDDFVVAWRNVKFPAGEGPLAEIYRDGLENMPAVAREYKRQGVRNLIALCRELQLNSGEQPFFLACRPAAALLKAAPCTVNRWLWKLIHSGVLELVNEGSRGRAAEYRYLGDTRTRGH